MQISSIYKIQSTCNPDKIYIGSAISIINRWYRHRFDLKHNKHGNSKLQNYYNKYGLEDLRFEILMECEKDKLIIKEQCYINIFQPYFNICKIAGSNSGVSFTEEHKRKIRESNLGKKRSEETKINIGLSSIGRIPWNKNKKHSLESILKMSISHKRYKPTNETIEKTRISNTGKKRTEESKIKMRKPKPLGFGEKIKDSWKLRRLKKMI
jgi:group I intron endonuclease